MTKKQAQATTSRELQRFALALLMGFVVLISPALVRAEPGESVSSWYWQGGSPSVDTFDEPQYMPPPHYISRYEAPPDEFEEPFITVMPRRPDFQIVRPSRPRKPIAHIAPQARIAPQVSQPDSQVTRPKAPVGQSAVAAKPSAGQPAVEAKPPSPNTARPIPIKKYNRITCEAATQIVAGYAFSEIKPVKCSGGNYQFEAKRENGSFSVTLSAKDGELIKVKKIVRTALR